MQSVKRYTKSTRAYDTAILRNAVLAVKERKVFVPRKTIGNYSKMTNSN